MKRKIKRAYREANAKLQVDRLFEVCRTNLNIFAFQNKSEIEIECLTKHGVCYMVTRLPKRAFFIDDNTVVDEGFEIYYNNFTEELQKKVKTEVIKHLGHKFYIKFIKDDDRLKEDKNLYSGKICCYNLRK